MANDYPQIVLLKDEPQKDIIKNEVNKERIDEAIT